MHARARRLERIGQPAGHLTLILHRVDRLIQVTWTTTSVAMQLPERTERSEFVVIAGVLVPVSGSLRVVATPSLGRASTFPIGPTPWPRCRAARCTLFAIR
ncbi:hypothetical protein MASSI9I_50577 [Massilia sp. 9I]|nr:hypothetical protein MASSI9I_50577 [Massilia sp. 9I]